MKKDTKVAEPIKSKRTTASKQVGAVKEKDDDLEDKSKSDPEKKEEDIYLVDLHQDGKNEFLKTVQVQVGPGEPLSYTARIDTGCPISLIKKSCTCHSEFINQVGKEWNKYYGINHSKLRIVGNIEATILLEYDSKSMVLGIVPDTMSIPILLERNAIKLFKYKLKGLKYNKAVVEMFNINDMQETVVDKINANRELKQ